ncbi:hypothetical protein [Chryseobacterium indoltheticum]
MVTILTVVKKSASDGVSRQENGKGYLPLNTGGIGEKKIWRCNYF